MKTGLGDCEPVLPSLVLLGVMPGPAGVTPLLVVALAEPPELGLLELPPLPVLLLLAESPLPIL